MLRRRTLGAPAGLVLSFRVSAAEVLKSFACCSTESKVQCPVDRIKAGSRLNVA